MGKKHGYHKSHPRDGSRPTILMLATGEVLAGEEQVEEQRKKLKLDETERAKRDWVISVKKKGVTCERQLFHSVAKVDYFTLRHGFIAAHLSTNNTFNFQKYIRRLLEDDFKVVVGVSPTMWFLVVLFLLVDVYGWHVYLWVSFLPLINAFELALFIFVTILIQLALFNLFSLYFPIGDHGNAFQERSARRPNCPRDKAMARGGEGQEEERTSRFKINMARLEDSVWSSTNSRTNSPESSSHYRTPTLVEFASHPLTRDDGEIVAKEQSSAELSFCR
ncbi:hypothetical protein RHSIM_Rhsim01G0218500 [Rhododendron simsii]|uniref:MLO-like protein n=1 Tax=Rhododendron simsii TaxID=118357 RepID=A0A834HJN6_RHOSS|nr:hypothetical protein RHSIM_Rhsim01G0218500 [Rhododendron simsii]